MLLEHKDKQMIQIVIEYCSGQTSGG